MPRRAIVYNPGLQSGAGVLDFIKKVAANPKVQSLGKCGLAALMGGGGLRMAGGRRAPQKKKKKTKKR